MARLDINVNDNNEDKPLPTEFDGLFGTTLPDVSAIGGNPVNDYKIRNLERKVQNAFDKFTRNLSVITKNSQERLKGVTDKKKLERLIIDYQEKQMLSLDLMVSNVNDHVDRLRSQFQASANKSEDPQVYYDYIDTVDNIAASFKSEVVDKSESAIKNSILSLVEPNYDNQAKSAASALMAEGVNERVNKFNDEANEVKTSLSRIIDQYKQKIEKAYESSSTGKEGDKKASALANSLADKIEDLVSDITEKGTDLAQQAFSSSNPKAGKFAKLVESDVRIFGDSLWEEFIAYSEKVRKDAVQSISQSDLEKFGNKAAREIEKEQAAKERDERLRQSQLEREAMKIDFDNPQDKYTDPNSGLFGVKQLNQRAAEKAKSDNDYSGDAKMAADRNAALEKFRTQLYKNFIEKQKEFAEASAKQSMDTPTGNKFVDSILNFSRKYAPYSQFSYEQKEQFNQEKNTIFENLIKGVNRDNILDQYGGKSVWNLTQEYLKTGTFGNMPVPPPVVPPGGGGGNKGGGNKGTGGGGGNNSWWNPPNPMSMSSLFQIGEILDDFSYKLKAASQAIEEWLTQPLLAFRDTLISGSKFQAKSSDALSAIGVFAENTQTMMGGAAGAIGGGVIGAAIGGPAGALIGASFGGSVGSTLADLLPSWIQIAMESLATLDQIAANTAEQAKPFSADLIDASVNKQLAMLEANIERGDTIGTQLADIYNANTSLNMELARMGDKLIQAFGPALEIVVNILTSILRVINFGLDVLNKILDFISMFVPGMEAILDLMRSRNRRNIDAGIGKMLTEFFRPKG